MSTALAKPVTKRRTASKEARQMQLIKATIRSIAKHGLSATTMSTVSKEAKLSQGIVNLHFQSKDRLLVETLRYVADEYKAVWDKALEESGPSNAEKIEALVSVDFEKSVCQRNKLAVWFAFWGETRSRPVYREICRKRDQEYLQVMIEYCEALIKEGAYENLEAEIVGARWAIGVSLVEHRIKVLCFDVFGFIFPRCQDEYCPGLCHGSTRSQHVE